MEDGAGQTHSTATMVQVAPNLAPDVITVPWVAHDPITPHEIYNGKTVHLKELSVMRIRFPSSGISVTVPSQQ